MPGWYQGSYGYHGDDGFKYSSLYLGKGHEYASFFTTGDIIGCGLMNNSIFFTRNGKNLGIGFLFFFFQ